MARRGKIYISRCAGDDLTIIALTILTDATRSGGSQRHRLSHSGRRRLDRPVRTRAGLAEVILERR
jgi:hypothetical protein